MQVTSILLKKETMFMWYGQKVSCNRDVYFKRSTNNGASFGVSVNLSNDDTFSEIPDIAVVGDNVYVVWDDASSDEQEDQQSQLFFKRSTMNDGASCSSVKRIEKR